MDLNNSKKLIAILVALLSTFAMMWNSIPVADPGFYYDYADQREIFNIPNFGDVLSNLGFLIVGLYLIVQTKRKKIELHLTGYLLAATTILIGFGSTYFHLSPSLERVFWDRLPMTFAFSLILFQIARDRFSNMETTVLTGLMVTMSSLSLIAWKFELMSLRPYFVSQYGGIVFYFFILLATKGVRIQNRDAALAMLWYIAAKFFEFFDKSVFHHFKVVSGHSIKHFLAAAALYHLVRLDLKSNANQK